MRVTVERIDSFPRLAWVCTMGGAEPGGTLLAGRDVEVGPDFAVEGVWDGAFGEGGFDATDRFFGSGVRFYQDRAVFVPSMATTDSLFVAERVGVTTVSNSLPLLLAVLDDRLDPRYPQYDHDQDSIMLGISGYRRSIPTVNGSVTRLMFCNLEVRPGRSSIQVPKPLAPRFPDYQSYYDYVDHACRGMLENARDPARRQPLDVFSTQSRGYDTTAINSVAVPYGIDAVFTCPQSKGTGGTADRDRDSQDNDDGSEIAAQLGLRCIPIDRRQFERSFPHEDAFYACLAAPQDANLLGIFEHVSRPAVLFTGILGEIWYPAKAYATRPGDFMTPELRRWDLGGHGLSEARLRVGLIQLPLPYVGAQQRKDILSITESAAMDRWRLGTDYDRPIPRRMAESRGVSRESFGQRKLASVVLFAPPEVPHSADLRSEFFEFLRRDGVLGSLGRRLLPAVRRINERVVYHPTARWYLGKFLPGTRGPAGEPALFWRRLNGAVFAFAANRVARDYSGHLRAARRPPSLVIEAGAVAETAPAST